MPKVANLQVYRVWGVGSSSARRTLATGSEDSRRNRVLVSGTSVMVFPCKVTLNGYDKGFGCGALE